MTKTIHIEKTLGGHIERLDPRPEYLSEGNVIGQLRKALQTETETLFTVLYEDKVLAIVGGHKLWPGVVEIWAVISSQVLEHPISFHREVSRLIGSVFKIYKPHRIQYTVKETFSQGRKWAKALGFFEESILYRFGPDQSNYVMCVRFCDGSS